MNLYGQRKQGRSTKGVQLRSFHLDTVNNSYFFCSGFKKTGETGVCVLFLYDFFTSIFSVGRFSRLIMLHICVHLFFRRGLADLFDIVVSSNHGRSISVIWYRYIGRSDTEIDDIEGNCEHLDTKANRLLTSNVRTCSQTDNVRFQWSVTFPGNLIWSILTALVTNCNLYIESYILCALSNAKWCASPKLH